MYTGLAHVIYEASKKEKYGDPFTRIIKIPKWLHQSIKPRMGCFKREALCNYTGHTLMKPALNALHVFSLQSLIPMHSERVKHV